MARDLKGVLDPDAWDHPGPSICDGLCQPEHQGRELWHHREPQAVTLDRHRDLMSWAPFRDDTISEAGIQAPGAVGWRWRVNGEVVEAGLEEAERVLSEQLAEVRRVMEALSRIPQPRGA